MKATEKETLPGQTEAAAQTNGGVTPSERPPRKPEEWKKAEGIEDREVPDHVYATYWG